MQDPISLLESLLFSSPEKSKKVSRSHKTKKKTNDKTPGLVESTKSSILSLLTEIQNDENGKMLLDLFNQPSSGSGSSESVLDLFSGLNPSSSDTGGTKSSRSNRSRR
jgi:hypothetical protein